jgi:hypothetical protein
MVLPLHECAIEPLQDATVSVAGPDAEPLHAAANPTVVGSAPTETSCLCVRV